ncbi:hypothetical protein ACFSQ7_39030 [Paenibacillus rhizoplanae]
MMGGYFHPRHSIVRTAGEHTEAMLAIIANRYIGANPPQPPVYRVHLENSFPRLADCRYELNLKERLPELRDGEFVYVWGEAVERYGQRYSARSQLLRSGNGLC